MRHHYTDPAGVTHTWETPDPPRPPLDTTGAIATLLVVLGVADIHDAANAVGLTPAQLKHEALAWGAAAILQTSSENGADA